MAERGGSRLVQWGRTSREKRPVTGDSLMFVIIIIIMSVLPYKEGAVLPAILKSP
jgi:hypothetical protein